MMRGRKERREKGAKEETRLLVKEEGRWERNARKEGKNKVARKRLLVREEGDWEERKNKRNRDTEERGGREGVVGRIIEEEKVI